MKLSTLSLSFSTLLLASTQASAQNLIADSGLELGIVASCGQGQVPDTWFNVTSTADTYSFDCPTLPGLSVTSQVYPHFTGLPAAQDGLRFIAGWSDANETFGTPLTQPLIAGAWYDVRAFFTKSFTLGGDGSYVIWLSMGPNLTGAVAVANIGTNDATGVWNEDLAHFQSPGAFTHMILQPVGSNYYTGSDTWSIEQVDGPELFCEASVNSTGFGAHMGFSGSVVIADNQFEVNATGLPAGVWGQFCFGVTQMQMPFGDGFRCVGGANRLPPLARADQSGRAVHPIDLTLGAISSAAIPDTELYFQLRYRDRAAGGTGFNLTDGIIVSLR
ncbi:MAG: hypothetical protein ACI8QZ_001394 [Chlamydiales bacterium]|jgi:hypothetical protein